MTDDGARDVRQTLSTLSILNRDMQLQLLRRPIAWVHLEFMNDETELPMRRNPIAVQRKREAHGNVQPASLGSRNRYGRRPVAVEKCVDLGQGKLPLKRDAPALVRVLDVDLSKTWRDGIGSLADVRKGSTYVVVDRPPPTADCQRTRASNIKLLLG